MAQKNHRAHEAPHSPGLSEGLVVSQPLSIGEVIDGGPWSFLQRFVVLLAALSIVLDGFDGQLIGFAIPVLIKEWGVTKADFAPVVAMGLVGMAVGSGIAGFIADRYGRRIAILGSVICFGIATLAIGLSPNIWTIAILRFCAGLGIGGALPASTTLAGEFTPQRYRTMAITGTIVCVPLGGTLAGLFASQILPAFGWRMLFYAGGAIPLVLSLILVAALPESPRWLARKQPKWPTLVALLHRMGRDVSEHATFAQAPDEVVKTGRGVKALFTDGRALSTIALWAGFFLTLLAVYLAFSWLPTMLTSEGLSVVVAGRGLTAYNLGGVFGALACAVAINRFGSRWPLAFCCAGAAISAFYLRGLNIAGDTSLFVIGLGVHGLFVNAVQSTMYAVAGNMYPTDVRASGTAAGLVVGRLGAILSAFAGAIVIARGGADGYLGLLAFAMTGAMVAILLLKNHIPRATTTTRR